MDRSEITVCETHADVERKTLRSIAAIARYIAPLDVNDFISRIQITALQGTLSGLLKVLDDLPKHQEGAKTI